MMAQTMDPLAGIEGYVLAGGRSSRMGEDKALLRLAGATLAQHAVRKLERFAGQVYLLGGRPELAAFAPLVPDLGESCGPMGGIEAALANAHSTWVLVMPVDMPFVPAAFLASWARKVMNQNTVRIAMFRSGNVVHPALCLLHADMGPHITRTIKEGRFKLYPALEEAAKEIAKEQKVSLDEVLLVSDWNEGEAEVFRNELDATGQSGRVSQAQWSASHLWFTNLNTPTDFAEAECHVDALDT